MASHRPHIGIREKMSNNYDRFVDCCKGNQQKYLSKNSIHLSDILLGGNKKVQQYLCSSDIQFSQEKVLWFYYSIMVLHISILRKKCYPKKFLRKSCK